MNTSKNNTELVDVKELAKRLSISPRQVTRLADSGRLPKPLRLGRCRRWRFADIERWLSNDAPPVEVR